MARLFDDAASQYLRNTSPPVTAVPLSVSLWFRSDDATINQTVFSITNSGASDSYFMMTASGAAVGDPLLAITRSSLGQGIATTSTGYTANTWHHAAYVFSAINSRAVYIDGGSKGTDTTSVTPTGLNSMAIGRLDRSTPDGYFSGRIAEVCLWNTALTDAEVAALARGVSPWSLEFANLQAYWPVWGLHSPEIDLAAGNHLMTVTGATAANHAPVAPFSRPGRDSSLIDIPAANLPPRSFYPYRPPTPPGLVTA